LVDQLWRFGWIGSRTRIPRANSNQQGTKPTTSTYWRTSIYWIIFWRLKYYRRDWTWRNLKVG
jgi:hypothetical protein